MSFKAKYKGRCLAECGEAIEVGDDVVYVGTALVHEVCAAEYVPKPEKDTRFKGTSLEEMGF